MRKIKEVTQLSLIPSYRLSQYQMTILNLSSVMRLCNKNNTNILKLNCMMPGSSNSHWPKNIMSTGQAISSQYKSKRYPQNTYTVSLENCFLYDCLFLIYAMITKAADMCQTEVFLSDKGVT